MRRAALLLAYLMLITACNSAQEPADAQRRAYEATRWLVSPDKGETTDQIAAGSYLFLTLAEDGTASAVGRIPRDSFDFSAEGLWIQQGSTVSITWTMNPNNYVPRFSLLSADGMLSGVGEYPCCLGSWQVEFSRRDA